MSIEIVIAVISSSSITALLQWFLNKRLNNSTEMLNTAEAANHAVSALVESYEQQLKNLTLQYSQQVIELTEEIQRLRTRVTELTEAVAHFESEQNKHDHKGDKE